MKTTAGLLLVIIACLVVSMLGYHAYEGFSEGIRVRKNKTVPSGRLRKL